MLYYIKKVKKAKMKPAVQLLFIPVMSHFQPPEIPFPPCSYATLAPYQLCRSRARAVPCRAVLDTFH